MSRNLGFTDQSAEIANNIADLIYIPTFLAAKFAEKSADLKKYFLQIPTLHCICRPDEDSLSIFFVPTFFSSSTSKKKLIKSK